MPEKQSLLKKKHFFTLTMTKDLSPFFWATFCLLILFSYQLMTMRRKWFLLDLSLFRGASNVPIAPIKLYIIWLVQFCQTDNWLVQSFKLFHKILTFNAKLVRTDAWALHQGLIPRPHGCKPTLLTTLPRRVAVVFESSFCCFLKSNVTE